MFISMPDIPVEDLEFIKNSFPNYLFFLTIKDGVRMYECSACGKKFKRGRNVKLRTKTENDYYLETARIGDYLQCPCCKKKLEIKNAAHCSFGSLCSEKYYLFFNYVNEKEVWFRGFSFWKTFRKDSLVPCVMFREYVRYKLTPGEARMWKRGSGDSFYECNIITDAFLWNHGFYCEKYPYDIYLVNGKSFSDTFLKYSGFSSYCQHAFYSDISEIKYLCWYAIHPQVEMLAKIGEFKIIDEMMLNNTDNRRLLDWNAKTPWGLLKLTHQEYNEYLKLGKNLDLLKTFHRISGNGVKDFSKAEAVNKFFSYSSWNYSINHKAIISVNAIAKKEEKTAYDALKYFEKISRDSVGACHHCPGITAKEAYELWADYIEMLKVTNPRFKKVPLLPKNVPLFPHDLKRRHDELLKEKRRQERKQKQLDKAKQAEEQKNYIKSLVEKYKKFKKVTKICKGITEKYTYTDGEFSIIVPQSLQQIIEESVDLSMCIHRVENGRYFDRIQRQETYILFLRRNSDIDIPYYILEVEPNGTIQQKRTTNDAQYEEDIKAFTPFLRKWQAEIQSRLTKSDFELAKRSKELREENFADLRKTKKTINFGDNRGELLVDVLEKDLLEVLAG